MYNSYSIHYLDGIKQYPVSYFIIDSRLGMDLQNLIQNYVYTIKYFLMTAMGRNLNLNGLSLIDQKLKEHPIYVPLSKKSNQGGPLDHVFDIGHIRVNYEKILTRWADFYRKNKSLLRLFFVTYDKPFVKILDFFVYAAILEGFYKSTVGLDPREYKRRIHCILQQYFATDFTNLDVFVDEIDRMRNDLFHLNRRDQFDYDLLMKLTYDLFFLIRIVFLNYVGCDVTINSRPAPINFRFLCKSA